MKTIIGFLSVLIFSINGSSKPSLKKLEANLVSIQSVYTLETLDLTKNCVGFSAPVSARAFAYISLGMYEANKAVFSIDGLKLDQLNAYAPFQNNIEITRKEAFVNEVMHGLCSYFYRSMSEFDRSKLNKIHKQFQKKYTSCSKTDSIQANNLIAHIVNYAKSDGADNAYLNNYPEDYVAPNCKSCWTKTMPGFFPALLPYYGNTRLFLAKSEQLIAEVNPIAFSIDSNSQIYSEAIKIIDLTKSGKKEYEIIAEYWDDSPGYSGTPPGHLISLTNQLFGEQKLQLEQRLNCLLTLTLAMQDAFILCWKLKYKFNFIRPISYIQQHIDPKFNSFIATPSFPEFTSGHSFQSGAAVKIMENFFTPCNGFQDKTNVSRTDIIGKPRSFSNFDELGKEISISRLYGGIHFYSTLEISYELGTILAQQYLTNFVSNEE